MKEILQIHCIYAASKLVYFIQNSFTFHLKLTLFAYIHIVSLYFFYFIVELFVLAFDGLFADLHVMCVNCYSYYIVVNLLLHESFHLIVWIRVPTILLLQVHSINFLCLFHQMRWKECVSLACVKLHHTAFIVHCNV